jgi:hypothetical protein
MNYESKKSFHNIDYSLASLKVLITTGHQEKRFLKHEQNRASRDIKRQKHDAQESVIK